MKRLSLSASVLFLSVIVFTSFMSCKKSPKGDPLPPMDIVLFTGENILGNTLCEQLSPYNGYYLANNVFTIQGQYFGDSGEITIMQKNDELDISEVKWSQNRIEFTTSSDEKPDFAYPFIFTVKRDEDGQEKSESLNIVNDIDGHPVKSPKWYVLHEMIMKNDPLPTEFEENMDEVTEDYVPEVNQVVKVSGNLCLVTAVTKATQTPTYVKYVMKTKRMDCTGKELTEDAEFIVISDAVSWTPKTPTKVFN